MRATVMYGAGDVRVEDLPDPVLQAPSDAVVRVLSAAVCGSDLHPYRSMPAAERGLPMGHEFLGVVEEVGPDVSTVTRGDLVIAPFAYSDNSCEFCREGLHTSCRQGGSFGTRRVGGGQAEAVRVPLAEGTLVKAPGMAEGSALLPSLLSARQRHRRRRASTWLGGSSPTRRCRWLQAKSDPRPARLADRGEFRSPGRDDRPPLGVR